MKTIEVVAAIIEHEGRILATQRGYGDFKDGWEFPGGKMEPGETPEAAIVREIEEELKVTIGTQDPRDDGRVRLSEVSPHDALLPFVHREGRDLSRRT